MGRLDKDHPESWRKLCGYLYQKRWRKKNRAAYNWYQKMYKIYGKKKNWPR